MQKKAIITCAITGSTLTPSMSPNLPVTAEQMIEQSLDAAAAGASMLHFHCRQPDDGRPTNDPVVWNTFIPAIRKGCDAIINMSASMGATAEERCSAVLEIRPEVATVIVGSMNYGRFKKAHDQGVDDFKYEWEREFYGPNSYHVVTQNTFFKIARMIDILIEHDVVMEFEIFDMGHLYILEHHLKTKKVKRPIVVQFLTGILGGITSDIDNLLHMKRTTERLFGEDCEIFTHGTGPQNLRAAATGALMGTNFRVGQEDSLRDFSGKLFESNADQVRRIRQVLEALNIEIASPAEARQRMGLAA
jgi:uncharacterized protein (DUF849 family)